MKKLLTLMALALTVCLGAQAQRFTDKLDRGLVAVKTNDGVYCSWRIQADEYYDVKYNLYRNGTKIAENLNVSNYTDNAGSESSTYTVKAVIGGVEQTESKAASVLKNNYKEVLLHHDSSLKCTYIPNDACCADVDGDGELEILLKLTNQDEANQRFPVEGPVLDGKDTKEYSLLEVLKQDGTLLWWVNCGPNMGDFQNNEQNIVGYDWDQDGKAEVVMRLEEGSQVHMADGTTYIIGADGLNGTSWTNYRIPKGEGSTEWFTYYGKEFLWYCIGATGKPYQCIEFPLKRLEEGETDLEDAWGDGYGHRSNKFFYGAPYLDGKNPSMFLGRGIYTRHKFIAYDVDPDTHTLSTRWTWYNNSNGPWKGQGYHNYTIADVDWDGRDEIVWGSMVIDDNGNGLSTTGLGHGDAQHVSDLNPYIHGQEVFACNEDAPANNYRDATTSKIYYRLLGTDDAGRALAGNFYNTFPGGTGNGAHDTPISLVTNDHIDVNDIGLGMNFRIFWDGDLQEECFDDVTVSKPGYGTLITFPDVASNNSTKATPCYQGDIFGDWREEIIERDTTGTDANKKLRIFTTTTPTTWRNYSLWYDTQYRNAMVWQPCGYNQPPHTSYFLGEMENITIAPPPITTTGRTEVGSSFTTKYDGKNALLSKTRDVSVSVTDGAKPAIFIDNAPSWVQGSAPSECTTKDTEITYAYYTHTLTGGAFDGTMRLVKQGDGTLVLPNVTEKYTGSTDVWAGKLNFDGTMESSPVWLNRFAELNSNGGNFKAGVSADYGSIIRPGGADKVGTITVSDLKLNFGSRVIFDVDGENMDKIVAPKMTIEKKDWANGPEYSTPVFEFTSKPAAGEYTLAEVQELTGDVANLKIEGLKGTKYTVAYTDNKIVLTILKARPAQTTTWVGSASSIWDLMGAKNFSSTDNEFVTGDNVTFNDDAANTAVSVDDVLPGSVTFANDSKTYTLSGTGSIEGETSLVFNGAGTVNINNTNKYSGGSYINNGTVCPSSLANTDGASYGAMGGTTDPIHIDNNAVLKTTKSFSSSQPVVIHENGATFDVTNVLTLSENISENNPEDVTTIHKVGTGTLTLSSGTPIGVDSIYIDKGTLYDFGDAHFHDKTIVLNGGTMRYKNSVYSYDGNSKDGTSGENVTFIVPKGKTSILYLDGRCDYIGKLYGEGTLDVHSTWVRCPIWGDWSAFTGTINAYQEGTTYSYTPTFDFANTYGIPNATLYIKSGCTVHTNGKNFAIGDLKGVGDIDNGGFWNFTEPATVNTLTLGGKNSDFAFTGHIYTCNVIKVGTGKWTVAKEGILFDAGTINVTDGTLYLNLISANTSLTGTAGTTISSGGTLSGVGLTANLTLENGSTMRIGTSTVATNNTKNIRVNGTFNAKKGSNVHFNIAKTGTESITSRSYIGIENNTAAPIFNGTVHLTYKGTLTLSEGMKFTLVELPTGVTMTGEPEFDLQALPSGLAWDTSEFLATGKVKVVNSTAINSLKSDNANVIATIVTVNGSVVKTIKSTNASLHQDLRALGLPQGVYVVKIQCGDNTRVETVNL